MGTGEEIHTERDHGAWSSGRTETRLQMLAAWVPAQGPEDAGGRQAAMAQVMRPGYLSPDLGTSNDPALIRLSYPLPAHLCLLGKRFCETEERFVRFVLRN